MRSPSALRILAGSLAVAVLVAGLFIGAGLWRSGWTPFLPEVGAATVPAPPVDDSGASGVAQVVTDTACTGWLLDTGAGGGPAYVITAGRRTAARDQPGSAVLLDAPATAAVTFGAGSGPAPYTVRADRVLYATMNGTDLAVLALAETGDALRERGIAGYRPTRPPADRRVVRMIGIPVQGLPASQVQTRSGRCVTGARADLLESGRLVDGAFALDCPGVVGGTSGSPLLNRSGRVVGMVTTSTAGAAPGGACFTGNPCELTADGAAPVPDRSYAVPVSGLADCFPGGRFALAERCPLPRPGIVVRTGATVLGPGRNPVTVQVSAPAPTTVRTGVAPLTGPDACDRADYDATVSIGPEPAPVTATLPAAEGHYLLCLDAGLQDQPAGRVALERDLTPPVREPEIAVLAVAGGFRVRPLASPPELSSFLVKAARRRAPTAPTRPDTDRSAASRW